MGESARTQIDPASLLAIIARKPRIWGESPIRNDFPETVRALLDRMDVRTRSNLLDDIRAVAADCGFAATVKAVETVINAGRTIDRAAIATCAKRILEGRTAEGEQDLKRYDKYMEGRA
ncbi:integrase [Bifidobacterium catenulatum]|uniref:Integrase n=1 Tax=Bifidobacterium catenulatum TaxID=1686 RepID=A0A1V8PQ03_9BIFI|nr:integrase [Bifidobacterium catenulatum]